jgi:antitoxin HicB
MFESLRAEAKVMAAQRKSSGRKQRRLAHVDETAVRLHIESLDDGGYVATSPDVPGLVAEGRSVMEAVEIAQGLVRKIVESCLEHGDPLPSALSRVKDTAFDLLVPVAIR